MGDVIIKAVSLRDCLGCGSSKNLEDTAAAAPPPLPRPSQRASARQSRFL